ncbi:NAD(P)-dependent alcohol dehydrogenase [Nocardia sp. 2]|uniref:NAD(P)-dependent alcohol dehydrogenase n=1 Tax=Nocardia acididurans TaxID=2802282 RepID=A0ABS1M514_9NOCA|nr:NAD(P)-dependent alcohol dehydrogenase [Nocardia acididurans]MBL1074874.1 NAD(P)-dependent alcohol dehydrogenase [Nocardia acididurans]
MEITAAVARGAHVPFSLETVTLEDPRPGEVLVRIVATGVCHTDLVTKSVFPPELPIVVGHEGAGIVERVGSEVTGIAPGDHVLLTYASCGDCPRCAAGTPSYCENFVILNTSGGRSDFTSALSKDGERVMGAFFGQSSFASYALVPARTIVVVDEDVDLVATAPFGCGVQTGAGAVTNVMRPGPDDSLAIFGVGGVGMAALMAARAIGVGTIVAVDLSAERLAVAKELGADVTIDGAAEDVVAQVIAATGGGAHFALDTTALNPVIAKGLEALRPLGTLVLVGLGEATMEVEIGHLTGNGKAIRGCIEGSVDPQQFIPQLLAWHREGKFPIEKISKVYPFAQINDAVADAERGSTIKPILILP